MAIDNNTPLLNELGYTIEDFNIFKSNIPQPKPERPEKTPTREDLDAVMQLYIDKKGHVSTVELAAVAGLSIKQIKAYKKEIDYLFAKNGNGSQ